MLGTSVEHEEDFLHRARMLEDRDAVVRSRASMLPSRAKTGQLRAAAERARLWKLEPRHLQEAQSRDPAEVERMILSNDDL
jgi:hypothetical protein